MKERERFGRIFALAVLCLLLPSCYVIKVGTKYLSYQSKARPVDALLKDPALAPDTRAFLGRSRAVRSFAVEKLGLKESKNYTSLADSGRGYIADVVQACAADKFQRYLWSYPIVGKLPYKGFFDKPSAEKEARALEAKGYDVLTRAVDGFSTLGFFRDPLWTFMRSYSDADLSDLIIHELSHSTVYRKGREDFNEEVATFIGERGSLEFLAAADGPAAVEAERARRRSSEAFIAFMRETAAELDSLYALGLPRESALARKAQILSARAALYAESAPTLFADPGYRSFDFSKVNNAYLDLYRLYWGDSALYSSYFDRICSGDIALFIRKVKAMAKTEKNPKAAMRAEIAGQESSDKE
jgi:predicted aminopeptidase